MTINFCYFHSFKLNVATAKYYDLQYPFLHLQYTFIRLQYMFITLCRAIVYMVQSGNTSKKGPIDNFCQF